MFIEKKHKIKNWSDSPSRVSLLELLSSNNSSIAFLDIGLIFKNVWNGQMWINFLMYLALFLWNFIIDIYTLS